MDFELDANKVKGEVVGQGSAANADDTSGTTNTSGTGNSGNANGTGDSGGEGNVNSSTTGLEETELLFDDNDNLIDKDGKVLKTKEQLEAEVDSSSSGDGNEGASNGEEDDEDKDKAPIFKYEDLTSATGFKPVDQDGSPISFDMTPEGIAAYAEQLGNHIANIKMEEIDSHLVSRHPVLQDVIYHLEANNGDLTGFNFTTDYSKIDVTKLTDNEKFDLIVRDEMAKGETKESAEELATLLKDAGKLDTKVVGAITKLQQLDNQKKEANKQAIAARQQEQVKKAQEYWTKIDDIVKNKKSFRGIKIPSVIKVKLDNGGYADKTADDFNNYLTKVVHIDSKTGTKYSQWNLDVINKNKNVTVEDDLFEALLLYTKSDMTSIVKDMANTQTSNNIREKYMKHLKAKQAKGGVSNNNGSNNKTVKANNLILETGTNKV